MKSLLLRLLAALYLLIVLFCAGYLATQGLRHTAWYKDRLYLQLLSGDSRERLRAASALAQLGAQEHLLAALKADAPEPREMARRALEYVWFNAAGDEAYQLMQTAYKAAENEKFDEALTTLNRLVEKYPKYAEGWNRRASVYWQMGQYAESIADCQRVLALNPNHYGAWQGIGICRLQLGEVAEACRCLRAALKIIPHDDATRASLQRCEELLRVYPSADNQAKALDVI